MSDLNIDDFCKDAARALLALYQVFPRPHSLFVEDLCGPDRVDEFGMHSARHLACFSAVLWLAEEGYLRYADTIRQEAVDQAVLTGRAFSRLSAPAPGPSFDDHPAPAADLPATVRAELGSRASRLRWALEQRASSRIRDAVLELLSDKARGG